MRLLRYRSGDDERIALLTGKHFADLSLAWQRMVGSGEQAANGLDLDEIDDLVDLLQLGEPALEAARRAHDYVGELLATMPDDPLLNPVAGLAWCPPLARPGKVICVGMNYPGPPGIASASPPYPVLFHKVSSALTGHNHAILIPPTSDEIDYEGELAVVIGRRARHVAVDEALHYVAGYTVANDIGARDIQARSTQWTSGKIYDTFLPLGPTLVTADEVPDPDALRITTTLNQDVVQDATTSEMFFGVATLVSYISSLTTLAPGDLILTGSPRRAGARSDPRRFLQPGDAIAVTIEFLGTLRNSVKREEELRTLP